MIGFLYSSLPTTTKDLTKNESYWVSLMVTYLLSGLSVWKSNFCVRKEGNFLTKHYTSAIFVNLWLLYGRKLDKIDPAQPPLESERRLLIDDSNFLFSVKSIGRPFVSEHNSQLGYPLSWHRLGFGDRLNLFFSSDASIKANIIELTS